MAKRKKKKTRVRFLALLALAMLIAGFLARRTFAPMVHYRLTHRPLDSHSAPVFSNKDENDVAQTPVEDRATSGSKLPEDIDQNDRDALGGVIHERSR